MSKAVTLERKQIRFLLKDFYELRKALTLWRKSKVVEKKEQQKKRIHALAKELRSKFTSLFFGEFRTEYKLYRNFTKLQKELQTLLAAVEDKEQQQKIALLLKKAAVYNAKLAELGSRGGVIEKILLRLSDEEDTLADEQELDQKLDEAIQASNAFEIVMQSLIKETQAVEKVKKEIALVPKNPSEKENIFFYKDMGLLFNQGTLILYDATRFREIMKHDLELTPKINAGKIEKMFIPDSELNETFVAFSNFKRKIKEKGSPVSMGFVSMESKLGYRQYLALRMCIIGYCEFKLHRDRAVFLGAYEIYRIASRKGFGTFFLELILSYASLDHRPVIIDREEVSPDARQFWHNFDVKRKDILKYPAALLKYPEEVGWTKKDVISTFGGSIGSTFDSGGKPRPILDQRPGWKQGYFGSFLNRESKSGTNPILDPLASLDKAFFYDGRVKEVKELMSHSDAVLSSLDNLPEMKDYYAKTKDYYVKSGYHQDRTELAKSGKSTLFEAGYAFFQSFRDTASRFRLDKHNRAIQEEAKKKDKRKK